MLFEFKFKSEIKNKIIEILEIYFISSIYLLIIEGDYLCLVYVSLKLNLTVFS